MEHRGRFIAHDEVGNEYGINKYVEIIDVGSHDNPHATIEGRKQLLTDAGDIVSRLEKGKYKIVQTDIVVRSDDPNAP